MMVNASNDTGFMNHYCYVNLVLLQQVDIVHSEDLVGVGIARFSQVFARWGAAIRNSGRIQMGPLPWEPESAPLALRGAGASLGGPGAQWSYADPNRTSRDRLAT